MRCMAPSWVADEGHPSDLGWATGTVLRVRETMGWHRWWWAALAAAVAMVAAIVAAAHLGDGVTGNLAEWVGGLGTVAAFAVTYLVLREEVLSRIEARRVAARSVSVSTQTKLIGSRPGRQRATLTLWIHNGGSLPITQVEAMVRAPGYSGSQTLEAFGEMGADRREERTFELGSADLSHLEVYVWFTDASGSHWRRRPNGELAETTAEDRGLAQ